MTFFRFKNHFFKWQKNKTLGDPEDHLDKVEQTWDFCTQSQRVVGMLRR